MTRKNLGLKRGEVRLVRHNSSWANLFRSEQKNLLDSLKSNKISVEHVGSTSIPGISAKPILDILLGLPAMKDYHKVLPKLGKLGYGHIKTHSNTRLQLILAKGTSQKTNIYLHLLKFEGSIWKQYINFRDYLITHKVATKQYQRLKIQLASKYPENRTAYTESKQRFIREVIKKAK